jgi:ribonuclease BN (tRNA processing enzyme)
MYNEVMNTQLTILGSGTCNLAADKAAASVMIEHGGLRVVYDFGRGTSIRLTELGLHQDDVEHIFLSHFHPDHVSDLIPYLHAASWSQIDPRSTDLTIYGPVGVKEFIEKLFSAFDWKQEFSRGFKITVREIADGPLTIGGERFDVVDLHHSRGLRFDNYAIAGDSSLHADLVHLLSGAEVGVFDAGHITNDEVVELAIRSQARQLVCSHQYRELDEVKLNDAAEAKGFTGHITVAHDNHVL